MHTIHTLSSSVFWAVAWALTRYQNYNDILPGKLIVILRDQMIPLT